MILKKNNNKKSCSWAKIEIACHAASKGQIKFMAADRAAAASGRSRTSVLEGFAPISGQIDRIKPLKVSPTATQKPKNQSPEHMDVVARRALSPLSAASGASPAAEGMTCARAGAHLHSQVSHSNPHQHPLYWLKLLLS